MSPQTGLLLRMIGPLIEIVCVALLLKYRGRGVMVGPLRLESVLYVGFGVGLALVGAGLVLVRGPRRRGKGKGKGEGADLAE